MHSTTIRFRLAALASILLGVPGAHAAEPNPVLAPLQEDMYRQGIDLCDQGRWQEALPLHERLTTLDPDYGFGWMGLGWSRQGTGDFPGAIDAYQHVLTLGGMPRASVLQKIAECRCASGKLSEGLHDLARAVDAGLTNLKGVGASDAFASVRADATLAPRFRELCNIVDTSKMSRKEGWKADLAIVGKEVRRLLYDAPTRIARSNFEQSLRDLEAAIETTSDAGLEVGVMRLIRSLGDGHTLAYPAHARMIPILMFRFSDGFYVTGATPEHDDLIWARVAAIEGHDPDELLRLVDPLVSCDNSMRVLAEGVHMLRCPRILHGLGLADTDDALRVSVVDATGAARDVTLNVVDRIEKIDRFPPNVSAPLPIHVKRRGETYWFERLPDAPVVYFQYNGCVEEDGHPLEAVAHDLIEAVEAPDVRALVIDLRWNGGGDLYTSRPLIEAIMGCRKLTQQNALFVIAGRCTFSAAMVFAAQLDRYTPAIFVGEPTGSSPNFIGETNSCTLPYSAMELCVSNLYWQTGFALDNRPWIPPRIRTPMSFAMWKQGRDESVEAICSYLASQ